MKCKTCGKNANSEYCFIHKPRKPLATGKSFTKTKKQVNDGEISQMRHFFIGIWCIRPHFCEGCNKCLGNEPLSYMFDHLLEKSKYPDLKYEEENIMIVCLECHDNKTRGFLTDLVRERIKIVKEKFGK